MPHYLIQVSYTPESWAAMAKEPQNRIERVTPLFEGLGGSIKDGYFTFGDYDLVAVIEMPDNESAAAAAIAASAGGGVTDYKTTPLLTQAEGVAAMGKAAAAAYSPPTA